MLDPRFKEVCFSSSALTRAKRVPLSLMRQMQLIAVLHL